MILSTSTLTLLLSGAFLIGIAISVLINSTQLLQLLKKNSSQEKKIKSISKESSEHIAQLEEDNESMILELDESNSRVNSKSEQDEEEESELKKSNQKLIQTISVLESEGDGEDPLAAPLSDDRYPLTEIDGIGKGYSTRLHEEGIMDTNDLAKITGDTEKIKAISETLGVESSEVAGWCRMAELMRVNGIRGPFAYLLYAAGVESLDELSRCNPEELSKKLALENADESKTPTVPSPITIESWIGNSRKLVNG
jgi:predicted flap endonuclease-1-like 5' DNA nuclease